MKVSFFERGNKLQVRVPYKGTYLRLSTGLKIPSTAKFQGTKQQFIGKTDDIKFLNSELDRHRLFILEVVRGGYDLKSEYENFVKPTEFVAEEDEDFKLLSLCNKYIAGATKGTIKKKDNTRLKPSTIQNVRFAANTLSEYTSKKGNIDLLSYNLSNIQDIRKKKELADKWNRYFEGFIDYMRQRQFKVNTRTNVILVLGSVINHYKDEFFLMLPKLPRVAMVDNPIIVLDTDFIFNRFLDDTIYNKLTPELKYTWEVCATILITTMRISDATELKWENLTDRKDGLFLGKMNKKTGAPTNLMLPNKLASIYRDNMAKYGDIFTPVKVADKQMLIYQNIEKLFEMYPELHQYVSASMVNVQGDLEVVTKKLYEWVKPHMLRKSAITSMLSSKISEQHVKFASGHSDKSRSFEKYRGFIDRNFNNELNDYYGKMK